MATTNSARSSAEDPSRGGRRRAPAPAAAEPAAPAATAEPTEPARAGGGREDPYFGEKSATLGDRIAAARQSASLTQAGLAARMGVGTKVISGWENDRSEPRANRLSTLSGLLGVSVAWLLTGRGEGVAPPLERDAAAHRGACYIEIEVDDLDAAQRFFADMLSCPLERTDAAERGFDFFGVKLTARRPEALAETPTMAQPTPGAANAVIGVTLDWDAWSALIERLRASSATFETEPTITQVGAPAEEGVFQLLAPGGLRLAFTARRRAGPSPW